MTNSTWPGRPTRLLAKLKSGPAEEGRRPVGLRGSVAKRQREAFRWEETEGSEGSVREAGRPVRTGPGPRPTKVAPGTGRTGVRGSIVARKARNGAGAKGPRKVEA